MGPRRGLRGGAAAALGVALALAACSPGPKPTRRPQPGPDRFPLGGEVLREGDILLGHADDLASEMIARWGLPQGRYSHSGIYYRDESGRGRVLSILGAGMRSEPPGEFYARCIRLALVRPKDPSRSAALGAAARALWARNQRHPARFDLAFDKRLDDPSHLFCDELVSYLYRQVGMPDPFVQPPGTGHTTWTRRFEELTGIDLVEVVSPNAVLHSPHFATVAEVQRKRPPSVRTIVDRAVLDRVRAYVGDQGYVPRKPSLGSRLLASLERTVLRRDYVRRLASPRQREVCYAFLEYLVECRKRTAALLTTRRANEWTPRRVRSLAERVCDACRDRYFRKAGPPLAAAPR